MDLDDGSSHYAIYNNLFLSGGLKLREGFGRIATNNITVKDTELEDPSKPTDAKPQHERSNQPMNQLHR